MTTEPKAPLEVQRMFELMRDLEGNSRIVCEGPRHWVIVSERPRGERVTRTIKYRR